MAHNAYPVGFYFSLSFEGEDAAFKEVTGINKELGVEEVASGGENRFKYRLPTASSSKNLALKRAIVPTGSKLITWCSDTLDGGLANAIKTQDVSVDLLDNEGKVLMKWTFHNAYPINYSVSDLKSQESEILIESIELAYTYFNIK
ncbi:MAG: phage tail protein [Kordia sp.]|uniref:phage tail protein n=1 Tax=Kordia sp. TaxID=1965332 RepID=UPI00385F82DC